MRRKLRRWFTTILEAPAWRSRNCRLEPEYFVTPTSKEASSWRINNLCVSFSDVSVDKCRETLVKALKMGINYIDTAPYYGHGESEEVLGKVSSILLRRIFVFTKKEFVLQKLFRIYLWCFSRFWKVFHAKPTTSQRKLVDTKRTCESSSIFQRKKPGKASIRRSRGSGWTMWIFCRFTTLNSHPLWTWF